MPTESWLVQQCFYGFDASLGELQNAEQIDLFANQLTDELHVILIKLM